MDDEEMSLNKKVFIKMAPLLDPFKYLVGKYNYNDPNLFNLPSIESTNIVHPKIADTNNSSFIDGFFSFLSSRVLNNHNFVHGLDYYGSFLAIKKDFKINIFDDIDYLIHSEFFIKHQNILFSVEDYSHLVTDNEAKTLQPLKISNSLKSHTSVKSLDETMFEDIFENNNTVITLNDIKDNLDINLVDITNSNIFTFTNQQSKTLKSGSTCSSRTSHTNDEDLKSETESAENDENDENDEIGENDEPAYSSSKGSESHSVIGSDESSSCSGSFETDSDFEEESLMLTFPKFPVQVICMEKCENTFDNLIINNNLSDDEWFSAFMQIIMILITYQKMFSFTHNDLHTNNIMYVQTNNKYLYYTYKKITYKVPTFGKIYKIIDFGRAIYKFNGKLFCSDSFQNGGDASTQYNTEPFFNDQKPRLEPNFSFDLCRLACSIFDYIIDDFDKIKNLNECSSLIRLIVDWCLDDNGINVLYKNNGVERYPDFKLYKMIARHVHKHTPVNQLERNEFSKFIIQSKNVPKNETVINIDDYPSYC